jgi:hypothetical protein
MALYTAACREVYSGNAPEKRDSRRSSSQTWHHYRHGHGWRTTAKIQYAHRQMTTTLDWAPDVQLKAIDAVDLNGGRTWRLQAQVLRISEGCFVEQRKDTDCEFKDADGCLIGWCRLTPSTSVVLGSWKSFPLQSRTAKPEAEFPGKTSQMLWALRSICFRVV